MDRERDEPIVLRRKSLAPFVRLALGSSALMIAAMSTLGFVRHQWVPVLLWAVFVAVMEVAFLLAVSRQRVELDHQLRTRVLAGRTRLDRAAVRAVEVSGSTWGSVLVVTDEDGRRHPLNMVDDRAHAHENAAVIRAWAGSQASRPPHLETPGDGVLWSVPVSLQRHGATLVTAALALLVPLSLLWHPVSWWGWLAAVCAGIVTFVRLWSVRRVTVRVHGDELHIEGLRHRVVAAAEIQRVVLLGVEGKLVARLDRGTGRLDPLPTTGDTLLCARQVQAWARRHGGGRGEGESAVPRLRWQGVATAAAMVALYVGCLTAALPGRFFSAVFISIGSFVISVVLGVRTQPEVRDLSQEPGVVDEDSHRLG